MDHDFLERILKELNRKRHFLLFTFVLYVLLASLFGTAGFGLIVTSAIAFEGLALGLGLGAGFLSFLALTPIFILLSLKSLPKYQKLYYEKLVPLLFPEDANYQVSLSKKKEYEPIVSRVDRMLRRSFDIDRCSYFRGKVDGIPFYTFCYDNYVSTRRARKEVLFTGRYVFFQRPGNRELLIKEKGKVSLFRKFSLPHKIPSESIVFDEGYEVDSPDEKDRLSPEVIDLILSLNREMEGKINIKSDRDGLSIFYDHYLSPFRFSLTRKATLKQVEDFRQELLLPKRLARLLPFFAQREKVLP